MKLNRRALAALVVSSAISIAALAQDNNSQNNYPLSGVVNLYPANYPLESGPQKEGDQVRSSEEVLVSEVSCVSFEEYKKTHTDPAMSAPYMAGDIMMLWENGNVGDHVPTPYIVQQNFTSDADYMAAVRESQQFCEGMKSLIGQKIRPIDQWTSNLIKGPRAEKWDVDWHSEFVGYEDAKGKKHMLDLYLSANARLFKDTPVRPVVPFQPTPGTPQPPVAGQKELSEMRAIFTSTKAPEEKDLQLGKKWICKGVSVKGTGPSFDFGDKESFVLKKMDSWENHYQAEGPRDAPFELVPGSGLTQNVPAAGVYSIGRVTQDGRLVTETYITDQIAKFIGYTGLPSAITQPDGFAVGYTACSSGSN